MELQPDAPKPRLCHIIKWPDFDGYGFNLHAEKSKIGQYIGKVDQDSPAMYAGLIEGDKIIEVNGVNISNENHRQVVERIKSIQHETKLLVIDENGDKWYKERKITIKSSQSNVLYIKTPVPRPGSLNGYTLNNNNNNNEECDVKCNDNNDNNVEIKSTNKDESNKEQPNNEKENEKEIVNVIKVEENGSIDDESLSKNADENHNHTNNINNGNVNENSNNKEEENCNNKEMSINENNDKIDDNSINDKKIENNNNETNKNNNHIDEGKILENPVNNVETKSNDVDDGSIASSSPHSIKKMSSNGLIQENNNNINNNANVKRPSSIASLESNTKTESIPGSPVSTKSGSIISSKDGLTNSLGDLNLNMSASEMRKLLAQRKKADPKKVQMDLKQKYEIIQQM